MNSQPKLLLVTATPVESRAVLNKRKRAIGDTLVSENLHLYGEDV